MKTTLQISPDFRAITVEEAKLWCRIDADADDVLVDGLIVSATQAAEAVSGRTIIPTSAQYTFPARGRRYLIPTAPVVVVSEVGLRDDDEYTILPTDSYTVWIDDLGASVELSGACSARSSVVVTADTGYADAASVPQLIKQAIAVHVGSAYAGREGQDTAAATFQNLLRPLIVSVL